jgi:hypothetical protein
MVKTFRGYYFLTRVQGLDEFQKRFGISDEVMRENGARNFVDNNDYEETSTTEVTFYSKLKSGDHINYFVYA